MPLGLVVQPLADLREGEVGRVGGEGRGGEVGEREWVGTHYYYVSVHKHFENFEILCVINNLELVTVNVTAPVIL